MEVGVGRGTLRGGERAVSRFWFLVPGCSVFVVLGMLAAFMLDVVASDWGSSEKSVGQYSLNS